MIIDSNHYLARQTSGKPNCRKIYRNVYLVRYAEKPRNSPKIVVGTLTLPKKYEGKRIRLKINIEEVKDNE